jgi:hypothetical protein
VSAPVAAHSRPSRPASGASTSNGSADSASDSSSTPGSIVMPSSSCDQNARKFFATVPATCGVTRKACARNGARPRSTAPSSSARRLRTLVAGQRLDQRERDRDRCRHAGGRDDRTVDDPAAAVQPLGLRELLLQVVERVPVAGRLAALQQAGVRDHVDAVADGRSPSRPSSPARRPSRPASGPRSCAVPARSRSRRRRDSGCRKSAVVACGWIFSAGNIRIGPGCVGQREHLGGARRGDDAIGHDVSRSARCSSSRRRPRPRAGCGRDAASAPAALARTPARRLSTTPQGPRRRRPARRRCRPTAARPATRIRILRIADPFAARVRTGPAARC